MYNNFNFESTQSRGNRILKALGDLTWGEMPDDGIYLKDFEAPVVTKEDVDPLQKPNIKSTLRQFWELREESCEDDNSNLSKKVGEMEIEKQMIEEYPAQEERELTPMEEFHQKPTPSVDYEFENNRQYTERPRPKTERKFVNIVRKTEQDPVQSQRLNTQSQLTQDPAYLNKLQKAMQEPKLVKGKIKHSQKFNFPSSSTIFTHNKGKKHESSQMSQFHTKEDIDDLEEIPEEDPYIKKKVRIDVNPAPIYRQDRQEHHKPVDTMDGKDSLKDKDNGRERGLQDTLDRAVRRASHQSGTRWLIKVVSYKTTKGIHTVEFICVSPGADGNTTSYAVINPGKQYYVQNIVPEKRYYFINPKPIIQQEINNKKVYSVEKIEEAV